MLAAADSATAAGRRRAVTALSAKLRTEFNASDVVLTDSGTSALRLAVQLSSENRRDVLVAVPAYGCYDIATAIAGAGSSFCVYDIDPLTLQPDHASLERCLVAGAGTVILVHQYGIPADMGALAALCVRYDATIIEDAAQGFGGSIGTQPLGSFGDFAVLSFGRGKGLPGTVGGALLVRSGQRGHEAHLSRYPVPRVFRVPAITVAQFVFQRPWLYWIPSRVKRLALGTTVYKAPWTIRAMPAFSAALCLRLLEFARLNAQIRKNNFSALSEALRKAGTHTVPSPSFGESSALRLPVIVPVDWAHNDAKREDRRLGIMAGYPSPLHLLQETRHLLVEVNANLPGAQELCLRLRTAPTHSFLTARDETEIVRWFSST